MKTINHLKSEEKKKAREIILEMIENAKKSRKLYEETFINPYKEIEKLGLECLKGQIYIEHFLRRKLELGKFITELFGLKELNNKIKEKELKWNK